MTYEQYLRHCHHATIPEGWRVGQFFFNVLYDNRPDLAETVRGTELDPFHDDTRISGFLQFVESNWETPHE